MTPVKAPGLFGRLLAGPALPGFAARVGARLARRSDKPFRFGKRIIAARHADVRELLDRDLDFGIAAVNAAKIDEVNDGPFILGMDRSGGARDASAARSTTRSPRSTWRRSGKAWRPRSRSASAAMPAGGGIDVVGGYARPIAAHTAQRLFGITGTNDRHVHGGRALGLRPHLPQPRQ